MRALYGSGGFPGGFGGGRRRRPGGFDLDDLLRDRAGGGGGFGDMFGDLFGGGGRRAQQRRPASRAPTSRPTATIGFTDAIDGVTISLRLTSDAPCPDCSGTGGKPGTKPHICPDCEGAGFVVASVGGAFSMNETCPACGGRQLVYDEPCPTCHGSGRGLSARSIQARIPAGVKDGQRIRLRGKGAAGEHGGPAGDLFVTVKVTPHRVFGRKGDNLTLDVPVSFDEAALGADIKVPTLLGGAPVTLKIPAGHAQRPHLPGPRQGAPGEQDGTTGDLLATVEVQVPAAPRRRRRARRSTAYRAARAGKPLRANLFEAALMAAPGIASPHPGPMRRST